MPSAGSSQAVSSSATRTTTSATTVSSPSVSPAVIDPARPPAGVPGRGTLAAGVGWLLAVLGALIGARSISDNSFMTHLANGLMFWSGEGIIREDVYSYTAAGDPVTVQSWLATVIYGGLAELAGESSIRVLHGLLYGILTALTWRLTAPARRLLPRVVLTGTCIVLGTMMWSPRPLVFGLIGAALVLLALRREIPLWSLLPIMWVWVNTHGSFPLALGIVGAVGVGRVLDRLARDGVPRGERPTLVAARLLPRHELGVFGWVSAGIALGAVNPLGPRLLWFPIHLMSRSEALEGVREWSPPTMTESYEWAFLLLVLCVAVALKSGAGWTSIVPSFLFLAMSMMAVRNMSVAALVFVFAAAPGLGRSRWFTVVGEQHGLPARAVHGLAVALAAVIGVNAFTGGAFDLRSYPVEEVAWLDERGLVGSPEYRLLTRETTGNYLVLLRRSEARVFMDDRFDFYPLDVIADFNTLVFGGDFADVVDRWDVDVVLWEQGDQFAAWLEGSSEWFIAHETDPAGDSDGEPVRPEWLVACRVDSDAAALCRD